MLSRKAFHVEVRMAQSPAAAASGTLRSGSAIASDAQEITAAWTRYAEEVMRHTSQASQALDASVACRSRSPPISARRSVCR
jgi:hypothetical protein